MTPLIYVSAPYDQNPKAARRNARLTAFMCEVVAEAGGYPATPTRLENTLITDQARHALLRACDGVFAWDAYGTSLDVQADMRYAQSRGIVVVDLGWSLHDRPRIELPSHIVCDVADKARKLVVETRNRRPSYNVADTLTRPA